MTLPLPDLPNDPRTRARVIDLIANDAPVDSVCHCPVCLGTDPLKERFSESSDGSFTCRDCGAVVAFGGMATARQIEDELVGHCCGGDE